jgi:hypothetical protein
MKINKFDVVELKDGNRATIIEAKDKNIYFAEVVNAYGITLDKRDIQEKEIDKIIYNSKNN